LRSRIARRIVALLAASATFAATPGFAAPRFGGICSVAIVTKKGQLHGELPVSDAYR